MTMTTITSHDNAQLKEIRKLTQRRRERERSGRFVAEGEDLLAAADAAGWEPVGRFCAAGSGLAGTEVEPKLLSQASGIASGTRAVAVYAERFIEAPLGPVCVYLHGVGDPGNVGTILRSASAFGADSVALGPRTADPYSPKAVRASMGARSRWCESAIDPTSDSCRERPSRWSPTEASRSPRRSSQVR
jgi:TrmH family RNA methyltransferase